MTTSIKTNLYWNTLLRIPVRVICFVFSIIVARILDPSDFGIMAIAMMTIGYANTLTNFGLNEAIIQKSIVCTRTLNTILTVDLVLSLIIAGTFMTGATALAAFFNEPAAVPVIRVMSLYFLISSFYGVSHAVLRRDMNYSTLSSLEALQGFSISVLTLILALLGFGYWALALGQIVPLSIFTLLFCLKSKWKPRLVYEHALIRPVIHFGVWNFIKLQINFLVAHIDQMVIARIIGSHALGIYDKAKNIAAMPGEAVLININAVMFSSFSRSKEDVGALKGQFQKSIMVICVISYPVYVGLILIAPYFVTLFLGPKWESMITPFQIILAGFLFKCFGGLLASFNVGIGEYKTHTLRLLTAGVCFAVLCLFFVGKGIQGIAWAFFFFCLIEILLSLAVAGAALGVNLLSMIRYIYTGIWSSLVMFIGGNLLAIYCFPERNFVNMVALIVAGAGMYTACIFLDRGAVWKALRRELLSDLSRLISKGKNIVSN